jgi:iron(III) transport system permease protein
LILLFPWLGAVLVAAPILWLAFTAARGGTEALVRLASTVLPTALLETALLLSGVALLATVMGSGAAWLVTAFRFPGSRILAWLLPLPLAVPTYVTALVYVEILDAAGPVRSALRAAFGREVADVWFPEVRSLSACIVLFAFVLYPYVFVAARAAFLSRDPSIFAAARTLGSGPLHLFLRVALPLARPAVAVGTTLVLLETLNDIGASEYLGVRTLTVSAYTAWLNQGDLAGAAQIACIALLMVAILLVAEELQRDRRRYHGSANSTARSAPVELRGGQAAAAVLLCALPFAIGFAVPAGYLCVEVIRRELVLAAGPALLVQLRTTILLAIAATVVALAWSVAIVLAARVRPSRTTRRLAFVAGLGYAVPGTILVIGLLGPLVGLDTLLTRGWEVASGAKSDLILLGSGAALVVAYVIRFMRVAIVGLSAQLAQTPPEIDQVARILGAGPSALAWHVQLPLMRPALGGAALLVFVDCLKELPATLLLRPLNLETLATAIYGAASRGSFEDGALAALVIVLAGLGPIMWLTRAMQRAPREGARGLWQIRPPSERRPRAQP